jgi:hypothetical protein
MEERYGFIYGREIWLQEGFCRVPVAVILACLAKSKLGLGNCILTWFCKGFDF